MDLDLLVTLATGFVLLFWLMLGASIGSFLNVVVYRLPRGMSLSHPPSRCPACRHGIRPYDNVPVLGWLWLGGRCRDCGLAISPRYPLVEALVGLIFLTLAAGQLGPGGGNLPARTAEPGLRGLGLPSGPLTLLTALHALLFVQLVAGALIDQDGQPVPWSLFLPGLLLLPLAEWLHPTLAPLGLVTGALGGALVGWVFDPRGGTHVRSAVLGLALIGGYLGWLGALVASGAVVVVWLLIALAAPEFAFRLRLSPLTPATGAALVFLLAWKPLLGALRLL